MCGFCNVWVCVCGFCKVWVRVCVGLVKCVCVCVCGFFNVWFLWQMCGCFGNICICIYCILVLFRLHTFILICYYCKD